MKNKIIIGLILVGIVLVTIFLFLIFNNKPSLKSYEKDRAVDQKTIIDLGETDGLIVHYYRNRSTLPSVLDDLEEEFSYYSKEEFDSSISYQKLDAGKYRLCAEFRRSSNDYEQDILNGLYFEGTDWIHGEGLTCFDRDAQLDNNFLDIKSTMSVMVVPVEFCRAEQGEIISGKSGDILCSSNGSYKWPKIDLCGSRPEDTQWLVSNGNSDNWTFSISCDSFPNCNGFVNASCSEDGCRVSEDCK